MFRELSQEEIQEFRQWARKHYVPFTKINDIWHPVVQEECVKINKEMAGLFR